MFSIDPMNERWLRLRAIQKRCLAVDFPPVAYGKQVNFSRRQVESIDDAVVSRAKAVAVAARHSVMGKGAKSATHVINLRLSMRRWASDDNAKKALSNAE